MILNIPQFDTLWKIFTFAVVFNISLLLRILLHSLFFVTLPALVVCWLLIRFPFYLLFPPLSRSTYRPLPCVLQSRARYQAFYGFGCPCHTRSANTPPPKCVALLKILTDSRFPAGDVRALICCQVRLLSVTE